MHTYSAKCITQQAQVRFLILDKVIYRALPQAPALENA